MSRVLIIGAGGVGGVVAHKCAMNPDIFSFVCLASRSIDKCEKLQAQIKNKGYSLEIDKVDADNIDETAALIAKYNPDVVGASWNTKWFTPGVWPSKSMR